MENSTQQSWKKKAIAFLASQLITLFGSSLVQMAIIWHVTIETSSGVWVSVLTLCSFLPQMLISPFAGVWADRYSRKTLIIAADAMIAAASLILALFMRHGGIGQTSLLPIIALSAIRSLGSGVQTPAVNAMIPQLVSEDALMRYNGLSSSMQSIVQFAAPIVAAAIMALGTIERILLIDVATAVIGIAVLSFIKIARTSADANCAREPFFTEMKAGVSFAFSNKFIGALLIIYAVFIFLSVPSGFLSALVIERTFGGNYSYLSACEIVGFAGMVLGGLLLGTWGGFKNRNRTLALGMLFYGFFAALLGIVTQFWAFAAVMFFVSFAIPIVQSSVMTMLQEKVAVEMQGRVFSLLNAMFSGFMPLGMAIFGPLADVVSTSLLMIGTGASLILLAMSLPLAKSFYPHGLPEKK